MINVISYNGNVPDNAIVIDVTSRSRTWSKWLSPFYLGPVTLVHGDVSNNFENAWQFSKIYRWHMDADGEPTEEYWKWARKGWADNWAHRYPMGKNVKPEYSLYGTEKLDYIEARKKIYIPLYIKAVLKTEAFNNLRELFNNANNNGQDLYIKDHDGYNFRELDMSFDDVINCDTRKMGHGFVLAMLLDGYLRG